MSYLKQYTANVSSYGIIVFGYDRFLRDIAGIGLQHEESERVRTQPYIG
ncbi:hypothetical protein [Nostoc sp.]